MWWEPENSHEVGVRSSIDRLESLVIEDIPPAKLVYGVGAITWRGKLAPLIIVDRRLDPRRDNLTRVGGILFSKPFSRAVYDLVGPLWPQSYHPSPPEERSESRVGALELVRRVVTYVLLPGVPRPREWMLSTLEEAGINFQAEFETWSLPKDLIVMFSRTPKPLNFIGVAPLSRKKIGTIGLVGTVNGEASGFTTAGHVVEGFGVLVARAMRVLGVIVRIGEVENIVLHTDAQGAPGFDLAVASPEGQRQALSFEASGAVVSDHRTVREDITKCRLDGAISGRRWGVISGPLKLVHDGGQRRWKNCWRVTGESGWFCKEGDSGGLVVLETGAILGVLVSGSQIGRWLHWRRMEIGFVQDLHSTIDFVRTTHGCEITIS